MSGQMTSQHLLKHTLPYSTPPVDPVGCSYAFNIIMFSLPLHPRAIKLIFFPFKACVNEQSKSET